MLLALQWVCGPRNRSLSKVLFKPLRLLFTLESQKRNVKRDTNLGVKQSRDPLDLQIWIFEPISLFDTTCGQKHLGQRKRSLGRVLLNPLKAFRPQITEDECGKRWIVLRNKVRAVV